MKTTAYTLTLLALTIQVMVNGQTQDNQTLKIRMNITGSSPSLPKDLKITATSVTDQNIESIIKEANDLKDAEQKLKAEVSSVQQKFILKQIEISQLKAKLAYEKFDLNKTTINGLLKRPEYKPIVIQKTEVLSSEAEDAVKMAKEMREEADAQLTLEARLAEMSNAEEKELLALTKQQQAITLLNHHVPLVLPKNNIEFGNASIISKQETITPITYTKNSQLTELIKQASELKNTMAELKEAAITAKENEKTALLNEAFLMEKQYISKQIDISLATYKTTTETFYANKNLIETLIKAIDNEALTQHAQQLSDEADNVFRLGKEMREEANAQFTEAAKLGEMSNAEEKEISALTKQEETFRALKKVSKEIQLASN